MLVEAPCCRTGQKILGLGLYKSKYYKIKALSYKADAIYKLYISYELSICKSCKTLAVLSTHFLSRATRGGPPSLFFILYSLFI